MDEPALPPTNTPNGKPKHQPSAAPVVSKAYDLLLWYVPAHARFPRELRFTVGARLQDTLLDLHAALTDASYGYHRASSLENAARQVDRARLLTRLAHDLRVLDHRKYFFAAESLVEIGRMVGGWRRSIHGKSGAHDGRADG